MNMRKLKRIKGILGDFYIKHSARQQVFKIQEEMRLLWMKSIMKDDIFETKDAKFYLPLFPVDYIQREIVKTNAFYEEEVLKELDSYIPDKAVIIDAGANIGNHSLYWSIRKKAKKIYSFEPVEGTFEILKRNININGLSDVIIPYNVGLSDHKGKAKREKFKYSNIGATTICDDENGCMELNTIDNIGISEKIDFIKIDVEGLECEVIRGAQNTLKSDSPIVFVESFPDKFKEMNALMNSYGYKIERRFSGENFLYKKA